MLQQSIFMAKGTLVELNVFRHIVASQQITNVSNASQVLLGTT